MKIAFVSVENSLIALGFRKMAALVRTIKPGVGVFHVVPFKATSLANRFRTKTYRYVDDPEIDSIASSLAAWDMICFSSMSTHAGYVRSLIAAIRVKNPGVFIVWGGVHCIVDPEDALKHADAVCVGEGERAFPQFLELFLQGCDYTQVGNFYFNFKGHVIRNRLLPLQTTEELTAYPPPLLGDREMLYMPGQGFSPLEPLDYIRHEGLAYNTIWSIGCPNRCIYCANSKFLNNHKDYGRLRYPPADHIIDEVVHARKCYPHLSSVTFHDDMFIAIPLQVLGEFAGKWKDRVKLPFAVHGLMSRYVDPRKMSELISAGMFRVRMGIQSGSPRTRSFYKRHDSDESILNAVGVINDFSKHLMTPSYDLIVDNPIETPADLAETIRTLHRLPRPYILNVFPLMVIPGTELEKTAKEKNLKLPLIGQRNPSDSYANILIFALCLFRLPAIVVNFLLRRLEAPGRGTKTYPLTGQILRTLMILKRALAHLRFGHFPVMPCRITWVLWKIKFVRLANQRILTGCSAVRSANPSKYPDGS